MNKFLESPNSNFAAVRDGRKSMPLYIDIDLSSARSILTGDALVLNIAANSLYIDADTTNVGNAVIHFQDIALGNTSAPMFVSPGFIANVPFTQLLIENNAQAGKRLRIFYGVDIDFQAGVNSTITIAGTVTLGGGSLTPESYSGTYKSITKLAANTPETIIAPATNVNGVYLWEAHDYGVSASVNPESSIIAKSSAPATVIDGDVIVSTSWLNPGAANDGSGFTLTRPVLIPAGLGIYYITGDVKTKTMRSARYTVL